MIHQVCIQSHELIQKLKVIAIDDLELQESSQMLSVEEKQYDDGTSLRRFITPGQIQNLVDAVVMTTDKPKYNFYRKGTNNL